MKSSNNTPQWAIDLIVKVCKENNRKLPEELRWSNRSREGSNGTYSWYRERIIIRAGTTRETAEHVLLHELAHHLNARCKTYRGQGHTVRFYKIAFKLYKEYGNIERSAGVESRYKKTSTRVYEKFYKTA